MISPTCTGYLAEYLELTWADPAKGEIDFTQLSEDELAAIVRGREAFALWCGNALRFVTREEAEANVRDLMMRWFAVRETHVVESVPVNTVTSTVGSKALNWRQRHRDEFQPRRPCVCGVFVST